MAAHLSLLPNEILSIITAHLESPRDLLHLALTNRRLAEFAKLDGWKALLKGRFALFGLDADARNAVHGITTLHKNWERKAFVARYLEPSLMTTSLNTWKTQKWRGSQGQTTGYQPSIDSYEEIYGSWTDRKETLAWAAGTQIVVRSKETGKSAARLWEEQEEHGDSAERPWSFDAFKHCSSWHTYQLPDSSEGRDDILCLKLLRPHQRNSDCNQSVFGTASGQLQLLSWKNEEKETKVQHYDTAGRSVAELAVSPSSEPVLAAVLDEISLAVYPIHHVRDNISPLSEVSPTVLGAATGGLGRIWSCDFLGESKVVIGSGVSSEAIRIYEILPDGFLSTPLRTFYTATELSPPPGTRAPNSHLRNVHAILPVPSTAQGGSEAGNIFLSGADDGIVKLHDLRSSRNFEAMFCDQTNNSCIYSLAAQGLDRIVVGLREHSRIKVFDLRLSGSHAYESVSLPSKPRAKMQSRDFTANAISDHTKRDVATISGGWNLFLTPRQAPPRHAYRGDHWRNRGNSSVYSLSIPSPTSPNVYAGLAGTVQSLTFHSIGDLYPDTVLSQSIVRFPDSGNIDVSTSYNPQGDVLNLAMYEHYGEEEGSRNQVLYSQDGISTEVVNNQERREAARSTGLDERWRDLRSDGPRWSSANTTQGPRRGGRGRGHGRGRGGRGRRRSSSRGTG